jgi:hypothetical protein
MPSTQCKVTESFLHYGQWWLFVRPKRKSASTASKDAVSATCDSGY